MHLVVLMTGRYLQPGRVDKVVDIFLRNLGWIANLAADSIISGAITDIDIAHVPAAACVNTRVDEWLLRMAHFGS
jgi:hypothetical protein